MGRTLDQDVAEAWAFVEIHGVGIGDEHPTRKGWYLMDGMGPRGEPMWFRPPHRLWRWLRPALLTVYLGFIGTGLLVIALLGP